MTTSATRTPVRIMRLSRGYDASEAAGWWNTPRPLTRQLANTRRGLAVEATARAPKRAPVPILRHLTPAVVARFQSKIQVGAPDDCWPYTEGRDDSGYGRFHPVKPLTFGSNRVALVIKLGRDLLPGMFACHTCDNPPCCNPSHLYEGTHRQNVDDKVRRGRQRRGDNAPTAVLTTEQVVAIRVRFAAGSFITHLADEYGIALCTASMIINGRTWATAGGPIRKPGRRGPRPKSERTVA